MVFVNGANLGRYWNVGPQRTLYIPAPVLKRGVNQVRINVRSRLKSVRIHIRSTSCWVEGKLMIAL